MTTNGLKQIFSIKDISQKQLTRLLKKANNNPTKSLDEKIAQLKKAKKQIDGLKEEQDANLLHNHRIFNRSHLWCGSNSLADIFNLQGRY